MEGTGNISESQNIPGIQREKTNLAKLIKLKYLASDTTGINRIRERNGFSYTIENKNITDVDILARIKALRIPPAWEKVWICKEEEGHLQATGFDKLNRKQYIYHPDWNLISSRTKFKKLLQFSSCLPKIRKAISKDLALPGFPKEKILAAVVSILEHSHIRIGNTNYEKLYGSFGLTTLKNRHVKLNGNQILFQFKGKKGIYHNIALKSVKLARLIRACKELPGKDLFQYVDETKQVHQIQSGMVNDYIQKITGMDFTAKDFRTWSGSLIAVEEFIKIGGFETESEKKQKMIEVYDKVAAHLGNTRSVCKKYYIHPAV
ncbi:MAG TPA: hypothetical protein VK590_11720, partial [Saprospiraceae bacterium]|nr:hypothetical protein [Saprospiraceae bacterium]